MKSPISLSSMFLAQFQPLLLLVVTLLLSTQLETVQSDANSITQACKQTPYYNLCVSSLKSDPRSFKSDVQGLALIMVNQVKARGSRALNIIRQLLQRNPKLKRPLDSCYEHYNIGILTADVPVAIEALEKGDPKFAETGMNDAANEASFCEDEFHGASPMTDWNKVVHDMSAVAAALVRQLL